MYLYRLSSSLCRVKIGEVQLSQRADALRARFKQARDGTTSCSILMRVGLCYFAAVPQLSADNCPSIGQSVERKEPATGNGDTLHFCQLDNYFKFTS